MGVQFLHLILNGFLGINVSGGTSSSLYLPTAQQFIFDLKSTGYEPSIGDTFQFTISCTYPFSVPGLLLYGNTNMNLFFTYYSYLTVACYGGSMDFSSLTMWIRIDNVINPSCTVYSSNQAFQD